MFNVKEFKDSYIYIVSTMSKAKRCFHFLCWANRRLSCTPNQTTKHSVFEYIFDHLSFEFQISSIRSTCLVAIPKLVAHVWLLFNIKNKLNYRNSENFREFVKLDELWCVRTLLKWNVGSVLLLSTPKINPKNYRENVFRGEKVQHISEKLLDIFL